MPPYKIKPLVPSSAIRGFGAGLDPSYRALATYDYSPTRAWTQVSSSPTVRGTIAGGPSYSRFLDFGSEQKYLPLKQRPALTASALPDESAFYRRQLGAIEWDAIDPYSTIDQLADQSGLAFGEDQNPLAFLRGAQDFLASKDIDIFGLGETGAPARAADYALAFPIAIFNKLTGQSGVGRKPNKEGDDLYYQLRADPRYWQTLTQGAAVDLDQLARTFASQYVDAGTNSYVVEQLRAQFDRDRQVALGLSSGNDAIDYQAKKRAYAGVQGFQVFGGLQRLPLIGTQLVQMLEPVTEEEERNWARLEPAERQDLLAKYGVVQMASDLIAALPALSGLGTVMEVARSGGTIGRSLAQGYDWVLRGSGWVASAGLAAGMSNWALSAASPEYSEFLGKEVDAARPISGSMLAGAVNNLGYFATGTYGAYGVARVTGRVVSRTLGAGAGRVVRGIGLPETPLYAEGLGGARMADLAITAGLHEPTLRVSAQRLTMSYLTHLARRPIVQMWDEITSGSPVPSRPDLDALPLEERILAANDELRNSLVATHHVASQMAEVLTVARRDRALLQSDEAKRMFEWYQGQARTIDDGIAKMYLAEYGPAWITREAGAYTKEAMAAWTARAIERVGGDPTALRGLRSEDDWARMMRTVHQYEFDVRNGELQAAMADAPGVPPTREAGRLSLVSSRHLFNDRAVEALAVLRGSDLDASRAMVDDIIDNTIEGERWFAETWKPPRGAPHDRTAVNPAKLANWLEDVMPALLVRRGAPKPDMDTAALPLNAFHTRLAQDGVWDLAFKPVDAAGNFVSYVKTKAGGAFQTPWLDYPVSNVDNIELGNRGMLTRKYDSIFRAFRTWRIAEFQRGLLFRNLTGGTLNLDVTAASIDQFHAGLLNLSRKYAVQPQTLGTVSEGLGGVGSAFREEIDALADRVFGSGPYLNKAGERVAVNWRRVIAESYRQSLRLNVTAGLTSHLKSRFGSAGAAAAWGSDIAYVNLRFNLSPLFKLGEVEESLQLNAMAGVNPRGDPWVEALFYRAGVGEEHGVMMAEANYDQFIQGLKPTTPEGRAAKAYGWYALNAPETLATKQARATMRIQAERLGPYMADERAIQAAYDAGDVAAGQALNRQVGVARGGTVESGGAIKANAPRARVDLDRYMPPPEHLVNVEIATLVDDAGNVVRGNEERFNELMAVLGEYEGARAFKASLLDDVLPADRDGLLAKLAETLRDDGEVLYGLEEHNARIVAALRELDDARGIPGPADRLQDVEGTPEFLTETIRREQPDLLAPGEFDKPGRIRAIYETIKNPIPLKQHQATLYRIERLRREFPLLVRAAGLDGLANVLGRQLRIPERNWAPFLMRDRELASAFAASGHQDDLLALLAHSGDDARGVFDELYASEEWATLTGLWAVADRTAADDAFRVHFFNPYRSAFERSLNHPLLGFYPLSWAYKAAREWMRFLYDNRTIAGLRLGMSPAVALAQISRAQNATFAMSNESQLEEYLGTVGPFGSAFMIFNLILPGDWSSIPFPASRTIRDLIRGNFDARTVGNNLSGLGIARDARLLLEAGGELKDFVWGPEVADSKQPVPWAPFVGDESIFAGPLSSK